MGILDAVLALACGAVFLLCYFGPAAWAVGDAQKRGQSGGVIVVLFWLAGPLSALIWLVIRPSTKVVDRSPDIYTNADDALADAARLDQLGEWDAAISLYENAAKRWPEQQDYIASCLARIKEKESLA